MKKKFLTVLTILVVVLIALSVVACTDYKEPDNSAEEDTSAIARTGLIANGTFYDATASSSDNYLKTTVPSWTLTAGSLTTSAVNAGVVDLTNSSAFNANGESFNSEGTNLYNTPGIDPNTPFDKDESGKPAQTRQDNNSLVIASTTKEGSSFYKSAAITLAANKYYCLQYSVLTNVDTKDLSTEVAAKKGAWVELIGGISYLDGAINTDGKWQTRYIYIESNKLASKTIYVKLWLGYDKNGSEYNAKGAVFFDNIIMREVTTLTNKADETANEELNGDSLTNHNTFVNYAVNHENRNVNGGKPYIAFESLYYIVDSSLGQSVDLAPTSSYTSSGYWNSFRNGRYSIDNTANFALKETANTVTKPYTGIVDMSKLYVLDTTTSPATYIDNYKKTLNSSYTANWNLIDADKGTGLTYDKWNTLMTGATRADDLANESKMLLAYSNDLNSIGYKSDYSIVVEKGAYYKISVWVYVWDITKTELVRQTLSDTELAYKAVYEAETDAEYGMSKVYFSALSDAEKEIVKKSSSDFYTTEENNRYTTAISGLLREIVNTNPTVQQRLDKNFQLYYLYKDKINDEAALKTIAKKVYNDDEKFEALSEEDKAKEVQRVKDFMTYKMLVERNVTLTGTTYTNFKANYEKWLAYDDEKAEYDLKYQIWSASNTQPKATVKLTGVGDDIEAETTMLGEWEQISFVLSGNQLSSRSLNLECWFGEGASTDYATLMMGGALFDNVAITELTKTAAEDAAVNNPYQNNKMIYLSAIENAEDIAYGGLTVADEPSANWSTELASKDVSAGDESKIKVSKALNSEVSSVNVSGTDISIYELTYENLIATASKLNSKWNIAIAPNKTYRLALWVKTDIENSGSATLNLMSGTDKEEITTTKKAVSSVNYTEYKEVVFYLLGDKLDYNYINISLALGTGTRFSTSTYAQGKVFISMINCVEIPYAEYNSKASGDIINQISFRSTADATDSVTNGSFEDIDLSTTDKEEFDKDGLLSGMGVTSSWSGQSIINNTFNTLDVSERTESGKVVGISWSKVYGISYNGTDTEPKGYEIYAKYKWDNESKEKLIAYIPSDTSTNKDGDKYYYNPDITNCVGASFRVRAVSETAVGSYSSYVALQGKADGNEYVEYTAVDAKEYKGGTVYYDKLGYDPFVSTIPDSGAKKAYVSPNKTGMVIESNYDVAYTLTSSSKTLSSDSYYKMSVWVKTFGDAFASVTLSNVSNILTVANMKDNYIGFSNINTKDEWVQYVFYIKTGSVSNSVQMELSLGNPYVRKASKKTTKVTTSTKVYEESGLSQGKVMFDNVRVYSSTEEEYKAVEEDKANGFDYVWTNNNYGRKLTSTVDSFDSVTANSVTDETSGDFYLGSTPNNYTWSKDSGVSTSTSTERMYGVYTQNDTNEQLLALLRYTADEKKTYVFGDKYEEFNFVAETNDDAKISATMKDFIKMNGINTLVMSNKSAFSQTYTSTSTTIASKKYYKLTFSAKALAYIANSDGTFTDAYAVFRFMPTGSTSTYYEIRIPTGDVKQEAKTYSFYIYNPSSGSSSSKWSFNLGISTQYVKGILAVDNVSLETIDEDVFTEKKTSYDKLSTEEKAAASFNVYSYKEDATEDTSGDETKDDTTTDTTKKDSIWDKGEAWLLISSIVIAVIIVIVIVVLSIRRWRKKHPKEVKGESIVKAEQDIKVVTNDQEKEDIYEDNEYSDVAEKPQYQQRRNTKKPKSKRK